MVVERLVCSSPTKANRVQSPAGSLPDFRKRESCRAMPLVGGFSRGSPVSTALFPSGAAPYFNHPGVPASIPYRATPGFSQVGIVPDDAAGRRVFSEISRFPRPSITAMLHSSLFHSIGSQEPRCYELPKSLKSTQSQISDGVFNVRYLDRRQKILRRSNFTAPIKSVILAAKPTNSCERRPSREDKKNHRTGHRRLSRVVCEINNHFFLPSPDAPAHHLPPTNFFFSREIRNPDGAGDTHTVGQAPGGTSRWADDGRHDIIGRSGTATTFQITRFPHNGNESLGSARGPRSDLGKECVRMCVNDRRCADRESIAGRIRRDLFPLTSPLADVHKGAAAQLGEKWPSGKKTYRTT
ncbi:hypothetical protein PR048_014878 [Dryococelus australis]|uniref:Uncharacterized protein n=1 Tax=Dryococelus australis TaxID=614101 RepID=A0ABQ9HFJ6_9NEOP|nr:hypothetical protein PR048_014878 [Dryococelus australis]